MWKGSQSFPFGSVVFFIPTENQFCGGRLIKSQGSVKTPNWPNSNYPAGISCSWHISVEPSNVSTLYIQTECSVSEVGHKCCEFNLLVWRVKHSIIDRPLLKSINITKKTFTSYSPIFLQQPPYISVSFWFARCRSLVQASYFPTVSVGVHIPSAICMLAFSEMLKMVIDCNPYLCANLFFGEIWCRRDDHVPWKANASLTTSFVSTLFQDFMIPCLNYGCNYRPVT